ncbi:MAG: hypothetical protein CMJ18_21145 [Phycisphaeraceae bacterium]|nr:hypothetical protein [Phycisphaeraceae bacterium]
MINCFFFFDDWMIDDIKDVERHFGQPQFEGPLITGEFGLANTVELPGEQWPTTWRMWYRRVESDERTEPGRNPRSYFCLAESDDGVEWRRARLPEGYCPVGNLENCVFEHPAKQIRWDPWDPDPQRRYKAAFDNVTVRQSHPNRSLLMGWSPDGVQWTADDNPDHAYYTREGGNDGTRTPFYSPVTRQWHMVCRPYCPDRRIAVTSSSDLKHWTDVLTTMQPDSLDPPGTQFYGLRVWPYGVTSGSGQPEDFEGTFVAMLNVYRASLGERMGGAKWLGNGYCELAYSSNGLFWNRTNRRPMTPEGNHGEPGGGWNSSYIVGYDEKDRLRFVVTRPGGSHRHQRPHAWQHAVLRKDGFAYLRSIGVGRVGLKGMHPARGDLNINFLAPRGHVRVQACDIDFKPLDGFAFDDCISLEGDELHAPVRWKNKTPDDLIGQVVRLEFELFQAQLYAVRWSCDHLVYADGPVHDLR